MKVLRAAFLQPPFGKKALSYEKRTGKMLMTLTTGVAKLYFQKVFSNLIFK